MNVFKNQIYAALLEILKDDTMYYHSTIGNEYCNLSEKGKEELLSYVTMMAPLIMKREKQELDKLAKKLVVEELKK